MSIHRKLFRAYDIRGHRKDLTPAVMSAIAHALGERYQHAGQTQLVLAHDARLDSPLFAQIFYPILQQYGLQVYFIGQCSSPMLYFSAQQHDGNGIMITASHNPKDDNGIKWIINQQPPSPEEIQQIGQIAQAKYQAECELNIKPIPSHFEEYYQSYQKYILNDIQLNAPLKIVLDGLHGSAGAIAQRLLEALHCQVIALRCHADGSFPDHAPDPSIEQHLNKIKACVVAEQADLGIALDGDGDRLVLIDERGEMIDADRTLCLFAEILFKNKQFGEFVYDVKCSNLVKNTVQQLGGHAKMIRTGSSFLRAYLQQQPKALFAGEYSGHYIFNDGRGLAYDDAIYAGLRVMEYLQHSQQTLSQALSAYAKPYACADVYIPLYNYSSSEVIQHFQNRITLFMQQHYTNDYQLHHLDGVRCDYAEGFILLRASNTGDYFTLRFDARSIEQFYQTKQLLIDIFIDDYPLIINDLSQISISESKI